MWHRSRIAAPLVCVAALSLAPMAMAGPPAPPPDSLAIKYLQHVQICPQYYCEIRALRPICPRDSIEVRLGGALPSDCFSIRRVELLPDMSMTPIPHPPIVRVVVDDGGCLDRPCRQVLVPWDARVTMPPMFGGRYILAVQVVQVTCTDSVPPGPYPTASYVFAVADTCVGPPPFHCLMGGFTPGTTRDGCNAFLDPVTRTATLGVTVQSPVALAGLEGSFSIEPAGWVVDAIEAVGYARGMHLTWTQVDRGARYVMFADQGAPIPPSLTTKPPPEVLRLTIRQARPREYDAPPTDAIVALGMHGADIDANGVPGCPTLAMITARVCVEPRTCDANHDGQTDVRDLVTMAHCLHDPACADSARFDCDHDTDFDLDDILCCARTILHPPICPGCPPDTTGHTAPNVRLGWGDPRETSDGIEVPIRLEGAESVGAARWTLRAPLDRYEVVSLDREYGDPAWLPLMDASGSELAVGLLYLGTDEPRPAPQEVGFVLKLRLRALQVAGGSLDPVSHDFSGRDGGRLIVESSPPSVTLPGTAALLLSEVRPQPFRASTRFSITLASDARVDVAVFDIVGRRIHTVHRGPLSLGTHEFSWDGRTDGGDRSRGGIYFLRAAVGGTTAKRRMVLLGSD